MARHLFRKPPREARLSLSDWRIWVLAFFCVVLIIAAIVLQDTRPLIPALIVGIIIAMLGLP